MQKSSASLPSLSLRIDLDTRGRIGPGKIQLLENIRAYGSISAAGRAMSMSYKRAWDLVNEINRISALPSNRKKAARMAAALTSHRLVFLSSRVIGKSNAP